MTLQVDAELMRPNLRSLGRARGRRRRALGLLALLAAAVAAAWAVRVALVPRGSEPVARVDASMEVTVSRSLEVRLAYAAADRYRTYDVMRASDHRPHELVPLATLASLETRGDIHGVSAGLALSGDLDRASQYLERAGEALDVAADRAALTLARGKAAEALAALDAVLDKSLAHPQALFNRAIALRDLGLPRSAAEAFDRAAALGGAGWGDEARSRAAALHGQNDALAKTIRDARNALKAMAGGGPIPDAEVARAAPDLARHFFNHALRTAPSRERVRALAPLAKALDAVAGGHVLTDAIDRAAARDFTRRAPFAATYAKVLASADALDARGTHEYLSALRASGETEMLLGAVPLVDALAGDIADYEQLARASGDPWFVTVATRTLAEAQAARGDYARAEETFRRGSISCASARVDYACAYLEYELAGLLAREGRTVDARTLALAGLSMTRTTPSDLEANLLYRVGDVARLENDLPLLRAYMREAELASPEDCIMKRSIHEQLATAEVLDIHPEGAVAELARMPRCDAPLTLIAADAMVDAVRMGHPPAGMDEIAGELDAQRATLPPGDQAFADVVEARLQLARDPNPDAGLLRMRRALEDVSRLPGSNTVARRAGTYAHLTLAVEAARDGRAEEALAEIAAGVRARDAAAEGGACALGVAVDDDRAIAVTRDAAGAAVAELARRTSSETTPDLTVPATVRARLAGCPSVRVFALPPLHGIPGLLPADVAWSYVSSHPAVARGEALSRRVVVSDVTPPSSLGLAPLGGWSAPSPEAVWLHGSAATPSRVLAEIASATEIELHVHGFVDTAQSAASLLALSPDADGRYALTAADLEHETLRGNPVVVLGACHAAHTAGYFHEAWNLPTAFIRAGARAVFASPSVIRDAEAVSFFDGVLARVRAGTAPAAALRDERVGWLARDPSSWVKDVIDFE